MSLHREYKNRVLYFSYISIEARMIIIRVFFRIQ